MRELVARIHALVRRRSVATPPAIEVRDLRIEPATHRAYRNGRLLRLTRKEFAVLHILLRAGGDVVSAESLFEQAWDELVDPLSNVVAVTVMTLRRKLGAPPIIETVRGVGYCIEP